MVMIGYATAVWVAVAGAFLIGVLFNAPAVIWGTLLQRRVPPELRGRVSSLDFFVPLSLLPVSMALAGPAAQLIGLSTTFLVSGVVPVVVGVIAIWWAGCLPTSSPTRSPERAPRDGLPPGAAPESFQARVSWLAISG